MAEDGGGNRADSETLVALAAAPKSYKRVRVVRSSKYTTERLENVTTLALEPDSSDGSQDSCVFVCSPGLGAVNKHKPFLGFGGSFTEAAAHVFFQMGQDEQEEALRAYFDAERGLGYTMGRVPIASCDFSLGNWTCGELVEGDMSLAGFSIEHYSAQILPLYRLAEAVKGGPFTLLASPWSPPPWMKSNNQFNGGGKLRPECAAAWATHYAKFVKAMAEAGVDIWGVSVQNEPEAAMTWESCIYTAEEEKTFVRDHLGPTMQNEGLEGVKIVIWDHNRDGMLERASVAYEDPEAAKYIWGMGYHWYGDARFESWPPRHEVPFEDRQHDGTPIFELRARAGFDNVRRVADLRPDKHIIFTEGCQELGGRALKDLLGEWKFGERYGMNIINDLNGGTEGWIDWNLFLNENGGPNHVENNCVAPIICDTKQNKLLYQAPYWYLGHFSKYIRPGAVRVLASSSRDALEIVAFANPDGTLAVVVMNQSEDEIVFCLKFPGGIADTVAPPRSITTFLADDSEEGLDPERHKFTKRSVAIQTMHGTFLCATDRNPDNGAVLQTAEHWSGWETFRLVQKEGDACGYFKTFHKSWLSVGQDGTPTTSYQCGERERFVVERLGEGVALRACNGQYLSVGPGFGTPFVLSPSPQVFRFR